MKTTLLFLLLPFLGLAQISSQIVDALNHNPIPFVNIWVKNSQKGTTSDANGKFQLNLKTNDTLVLSAIGFEGREIPLGSISSLLKMNKSVELLEAVTIKSMKFEKEEKIGKIHTGRYNLAFASYGEPWMIASEIPYNDEFEKTPYVKTIIIGTDSEIDEAKFAVRLYAMADSLNQFLLHDQPIYGYAKKGSHKTEIDLSDFKLKFPLDGLVIELEFLIVESNKYQFETRMRSTGKKEMMISYEPAFWMRNKIQISKSTLQYDRGKWQSRDSFNKKGDKKELAIQLVMTD